MGVLSRVTSRIRRTVAGPSGRSGNDDDRMPAEYGSHRDDRLLSSANANEDEELPTYDELFQPSPGVRALARPKEKYKSRLRSDDIFKVLAPHFAWSALGLLPRLALLDRSTYDTVIPHLYQTVPIDRNTIHQLLYGIPIPIQGFIFDPDYDEKGKGKEKSKSDSQSTLAISHDSEERKRRCFSHTKRVIVESFIPDWATCRCLSILQAPETRFRDTSDNAPELQYYPSRQRVADWEKTANRTGLLMPNVDTVQVRPGAIQALIQWEAVDRSSHLLFDALANLCRPITVEIRGSVADLIVASLDYTPNEIERSRTEIAIRKAVSRFGLPPWSSSVSRRRVTRLVWYGVTTDPLPYVSRCEIEIHFSALKGDIRSETGLAEAKTARIEQIHEALRLCEYYEDHTPTWRFVTPGILHPNLDEQETHTFILEAIAQKVRQSTSTKPPNYRIYSLEEAVAEGLVSRQ